MTAVEYQAKSIFFAALEREPDQWSAFVDESSSENAELRARVNQLLQAHRSMGSIHGDDSTAGDALREGPGTVIGPYKLLEQIGEGGFGVVFMAEQTEPVRRKVAVKVLKPGMDTRQVVARFEAERQALALMDHPNIARVLDAGETATGRPYFAMELVRGIPITQFCDENRLTSRQRLELFATVCQAVQHAHQKGIIHRDLKPTNVLVTLHDGTPVAKVIDFGIAKAIGERLTDKTLFTNFAQMVGTPMYMSPEQAQLSGLDIDTRSDIYSLGVLLYELLTGTTPFDKERLRTANFDEIRRIIREEEPPRPSSRISTLGLASTTVSTQRNSDPRKLSRLFRHELDWIVMKALEKDRNRRYETASALAADVQRYLHDEPVLACPPSAWYRVRKLARRNKGMLVTASTLLAALVVVVVALAISNVLISREKDAKDAALAETNASNIQIGLERDAKDAALTEAKVNLGIANEQRRQARRAVDDMYTQVAEKWLRTQGSLIPVQKEFLLKALEFYEGFAKETGVDPATRHEMGMAYFRVAEIQQRLGEYDKARDAYDRAIGQWDKLTGEVPENREYREHLARSYAGRAGIHRRNGRAKDADSDWQHAEDLYAALAVENPGLRHLRNALAAVRSNRANSFVDAEHREEALALLRKNLETFAQLVDEAPTVTGYRYNLASGHLNIARLLTELGKLDEAEKEVREGLAIYDKLNAEAPNQLEPRHGIARGQNELGIIVSRVGRYDEAEKAYRQAIAVEQKIVAAAPEVADYNTRLRQYLHNLAMLLVAKEQPEEAESLFRQLLKLKPGDPYGNYGLAWLRIVWPARASDPKETIELAKKAVAALPDSPNVYRALGAAYYRATDHKAAIEALDKSLQLRKDGGTSYEWFFLAMAHWKAGKREEARKTYDQAIEWMMKNGPKNAELIRFRAEAAALLGLKEQKDR